jgi:putative DNA primase/helicase
MAHYASNELRYSTRIKQWYNWDGRRWNEAVAAEMIEVARRVMPMIYLEASIASTEGDPSPAELHGSFAVKSHSLRAIEAMIHLTIGDARLWVDNELFDLNPYLFNFLNGTLDIRTGILRSHDPREMITKLIPRNYIPSAEAPRWRKLVGRTFLSANIDGQTVRFVQKALGYSLLCGNPEQIQFTIAGAANCGKSKALEITEAIVGPNYAHKSESDLISRVSGGHHAREKYGIIGKRFVYISETNSQFNLDESAFKELVADRRVPVNELYAKKATSTPITWTIWLATNTPPNVLEWDNAVSRRMIIIPAGPTIPDNEVDDLYDVYVIEHEAEGVLAWLVDGARMWYADRVASEQVAHMKTTGFTLPESVAMETAKYAESQDHLKQFIRECIIIDPSGRVEKKDVHEAFKRWRGKGESSNRNKLYAEICTIPGVTVYRDREFLGINLTTPSFTELMGRAGEVGG